MEDEKERKKIKLRLIRHDVKVQVRGISKKVFIDFSRDDAIIRTFYVGRAFSCLTLQPSPKHSPRTFYRSAFDRRKALALAE